MHFVVAYDIADPKRLRKVARAMERGAIRCQKSVFVFRGDVSGLQALLDQVAGLLKLEEDIVQAWRICSNQDTAGLQRGTATNIHPESVVLEPRKHWFIGKRSW